MDWHDREYDSIGDTLVILHRDTSWTERLISRYLNNQGLINPGMTRAIMQNAGDSCLPCDRNLRNYHFADFDSVTC
jgi:hypothetical protein